MDSKKTASHQWEDDHCIKCGDADWYAGPTCSECKIKTEETT